jgi:DNA-binding response OmpR family regulator
MLFGRKKRRISRLLIVEDEPLVAFDTEHFLGDEGFEIVGTIDTVAGARALIASGRPIDMMLVDVNLTDGSGIDVARAAHAAGICVMFVTGSCPSEAREYAAGCLSKPYALRTLVAAIATIEAVLDGGKPPKRLPAGFSLFLATA